MGLGFGNLVDDIEGPRASFSLPPSTPSNTSSAPTRDPLLPTNFSLLQRILTRPLSTRGSQKRLEHVHHRERSRANSLVDAHHASSASSTTLRIRCDWRAAAALPRLLDERDPSGTLPETFPTLSTAPRVTRQLQLHAIVVDICISIP